MADCGLGRWYDVRWRKAESWLTPEREQAELLLGKAHEDRVAMVALATSPRVSDAPVGFHAQQAVEKALKAVLAVHGEDYPWTHDLQLLMRRLELAGVELPSIVREARRLTPWAVEFRYGEVLDEALDRAAAGQIVDAVLEWAAVEVRDRGS